ncbi:hypothetical protein D8895_12555 [Streptococcus sp. BCA20]|nr:hypothetical protein D8895_12555 [Streptococcus sp. BCA20]
MITGQAESEGLICFEQVADISPRVVAASVAITIMVKRSEIFLKLGIFNNQTSFTGHTGTVSGNPSRQDAIKHINTTDNTINQAIWRSNSHEIAGLVFRQHRRCEVQHCIHLFVRLANSQSSDRVARKIHADQVLSRLAAQIFKASTLNNPKETLVLGTAVRLESTLCPTASPLDGLLNIVIRLVELRTLIKRHHDITA